MGEAPKRIIQFYDGRMVPNNESFGYGIIKKIFGIMLILLIFELILFRDVLLSSKSIPVWVCLSIIIIFLIKYGGHTRAKCYSELQLYEDFMIFYVPKHHLKKNKENMEFQKMFYKDVKECTYRVNTRKYVIFGKVEETHYRYDKNQSVNKVPFYHKEYDGMIKFYTVFDNAIDFKKEIETYTPLTVKEEKL